MKSTENINKMVKVSILSAMSFLLMFIEISLPFFPPFLKIDISDLPALIGALTIGPVAGVMVEFIKNFLNYVTKTSTGGIGDLANFIFGSALILPVSIIYRKRSDLIGYIVASIVGGISMVIIACISNYFFFIPAYAAFYGAPIESFVAMTQKVNGLVTDYKTMIIFAFGPFNIMKSLLITILGYILYKRVSFIQKLSRKQEK